MCYPADMADRFGITRATLTESGEIQYMLRCLQEELQQYGSLSKPGPKTDEWIRAVVDKAITGSGVALVARMDAAQLIGCSVAAEIDLPYDTGYKRVAGGFGTYVQPAHRKIGVANALYDAMRIWLTDDGFDVYLGGYLMANHQAARVVEQVGFIPFEMNVIMPLGDT